MLWLKNVPESSSSCHLLSNHQTTSLDELCCPLQFLPAAVELRLQRNLRGPDGLPQYTVYAALLEDVLCRLVLLATRAEWRLNQSQFCGKMVVETVVSRAKPQQDDLFLSIEGVVVIFLQSGPQHGLYNHLFLLETEV